MKFGKHIRLLAKKEWQKHYVDYKLCKQLLRGRVSIDEAGAVTVVHQPQPADERTTELEGEQQPERLSDLPVDELASILLQLLTRQLKKSSAFYLKKVEDCHKIADGMLKELRKAGRKDAAQAGSSSEDTPVAADGSQPTTAPSSPPLPALSPSADHVTSAQLVMDSTVPMLDGSKASNEKVELMPAAQLADGATAPPEITEQFTSGTALRLSQKELLACLLLVEDLREFANLNQTAVAKITKKFNKKFGKDIQAEANAILTASAVADTKELDGIDEACQKIMESMPANLRRRKTLKRVKAPVVTISQLDLAAFKNGCISCMWLSVGTNALGEPISVPVMVAKGYRDGPVVGITSTIHGNELNGIPVIHQLFDRIDCETLNGTVVAVPVVNVHGYTRYQRAFSDGYDLNRIMPGKKGSTCSQSFAYWFFHKVITKVHYLLDLHTAGFGRVNSLYVRADMNDPVASRLAKLQNPQIILHNTGPDGSLRGSAGSIGIPALTIEIGNPQRFHQPFIRRCEIGIENVMSYLKMTGDEVVPADAEPVTCNRSYWIFSKTGGVLTVFPAVATWVTKGEVVGEVRDLFGRLIDRYVAKEDCIIIGKNDNPVAQSGDRVVHCGLVGAVFRQKLTTQTAE